MLKKYTISLSVLSLCLLLIACGDTEPKINSKPGPAPSSGNPTIDALNQKISNTPNNPDLYAARAEAFYAEEGYDEAIADMASALALDSNNVNYHHILADIYLDYFQSQKALATMERAASLYPERIPTLLKLSEFQMILEQYEPSLRTVDKILQMEPLNAEAYVMMGMNFEQMGDAARAINSFQTAIENDPSLTDIWIKLAQMLYRQDSKLAVRYFDNAIESAPNDPLPYYAKAEFLHNTNQLDEALKMLKETILRDQQYNEAFFRTGIIYLEKDSLGQAYNNFNIVVSNDPLLAKGYYYRGLVAQKQGNDSQARSDFEQTLTLDAKHDRARRALESLP